jgi:hypothetical protein
MRFAALSDQINNIDKKIEGLRLDMQAAIHNEFMYLVNKMLYRSTINVWNCGTRLAV